MHAIFSLSLNFLYFYIVDSEFRPFLRVLATSNITYYKITLHNNIASKHNEGVCGNISKIQQTNSLAKEKETFISAPCNNKYFFQARLTTDLRSWVRITTRTWRKRAGESRPVTEVLQCGRILMMGSHRLTAVLQVNLWSDRYPNSY